MNLIYLIIKKKNKGCFISVNDKIAENVVLYLLCYLVSLKRVSRLDNSFQLRKPFSQLIYHCITCCCLKYKLLIF